MAAQLALLALLNPFPKQSLSSHRYVYQTLVATDLSQKCPNPEHIMKFNTTLMNLD